MANPPAKPNFSDDSPDAEESFTCVGFNLNPFKVSATQMMKNCRSVSHYEKISTIGYGQFGTVYKCIEKASQRIFALKRPRTDPDSNEGMPQSFLRQIALLKKYQHPNLVNLKEVVVGKNIYSNYLVLDYCHYSLENIIDEAEEINLQPFHVKNIMRQLLTGLQQLHRWNMIHRDICTKNVLITKEGILKISDFGSVRTPSYGEMTPNLGQQWFRAPELLFGTTKYTKAVDIWSTGCIFANLLVPDCIYRNNTANMLQLLGSPIDSNQRILPHLIPPEKYIFVQDAFLGFKEIFSFINPEASTYLLKFLKYNPAARANVENVMDDPYYHLPPRACSNLHLVYCVSQTGEL